MKTMSLIAAICSFLNAVIALKTNDIGYALGLFGGGVAWLIIYLNYKLIYK